MPSGYVCIKIRGLFFLRFWPNTSITCSPDSRNFKKLTPLYMQVTQILSSTKYSFNPFSVI